MMTWRAWASMALVVATVSTASAQAPSAEAPSYGGVELARRIEGSRSSQKRAELSALASLLAPAEQRALVDWAAGETWWFLSEALARVGSHQAAGLLAQAARDVPVDEGAPNARHLLHRSGEAIEALGSVCAPETAVPALIEGYLQGDRRQRGRHRRAILEAVCRGGQGLHALATAPWPAPPPAWLEEDLTRLCAEAYALSESRLELLGAATLAPATWTRLGTVRGIGERARQVRELVAAGKPGDEAYGLRERPACEGELARWWDGAAPDPLEDPESEQELERLQLRVVICEALPFLLDELSEAWARALIADLDPEVTSRAHRDAAWGALKRISGESLPQSFEAWRTWWDGAGEDEDDDEEADE